MNELSDSQALMAIIVGAVIGLTCVGLIVFPILAVYSYLFSLVVKAIPEDLRRYSPFFAWLNMIPLANLFFQIYLLITIQMMLEEAFKKFNQKMETASIIQGLVYAWAGCNMIIFFGFFLNAGTKLYLWDQWPGVEQNPQNNVIEAFAGMPSLCFTFIGLTASIIWFVMVFNQTKKLKALLDETNSTSLSPDKTL